MTVIMFEKKSATVELTVFDGGIVKDITGGTPRAAMESPSGGKKILTAAITSPTKGVVRVTIPKASVDIQGTWFAECALEFGDDDRTIWQEDLLARRSIL